MHGKRFLLSFDEYLNGKKIMEDTSLLICKDDTIKFMRDSVEFGYEIFNFCNDMTFLEEDSVYRMRFAGKLTADSFKLAIYGCVNFTRKLAGKENYSFRPVICTNDLRFPINQLTPLLAYTSPFETDAKGSGSFCILGTEKVETWFEKFKVKHYYIINLKIE
jgi:hypothetical protein